MKRREMLQALGSASVVGLFSNVLSTHTQAQGVRPFTVRGSGPALIVFDRQPGGYYDRLTDRYRVVVIGDVAPDNPRPPSRLSPPTAPLRGHSCRRRCSRRRSFRLVWLFIWQRCRSA